MLTLKGGALSTAFTAVPTYTSISGILGLIIVASIGYTVPRLGVTTALTLVLVGQYFLATLMDNNGWFGTPIPEIGFKQISGLVDTLNARIMRQEVFHDKEAVSTLHPLIRLE